MGRGSKKRAVNEPDVNQPDVNQPGDKSSGSFYKTENPNETGFMVHHADESEQNPQNGADSTLNITLLVIAVSLAFNRLKLENEYILTLPYSTIFALTTFSFLTGYKWEIASNAAYNAMGWEIKEDDKVNNKSVNKSIPFRTVLGEAGGLNRNMLHNQARPSCRAIGYVITENTLAETYADKVEPLFSYRGMDIFTYLEMPSWVKKFDSIVETESDSNEIKALKRFFNGSDEYRNQRFKIMPYLVKGPLIIKKLAPPPKKMR